MFAKFYPGFPPLSIFIHKQYASEIDKSIIMQPISAFSCIIAILLLSCSLGIAKPILVPLQNSVRVLGRSWPSHNIYAEIAGLESGKDA